MTDRVINVLFLCTGNSARSILGEAILRKEGEGRFAAFSAGSFPKPDVNPMAVEVLQDHGYPTDGLRSKSWDEFDGSDAPVMDFVFTVCDDAANEACPLWPGHPITGHWGLEDPAKVEGTHFERKVAFEKTLGHLRRRIQAFVALPMASLDRLAMGREVKEIGGYDGATAQAKG
jgi:arsenate reductase (thioredoxin)